MNEKLTDQEKVFSFLDTHNVCVVSTVRKPNEVDAAPVYFVRVDNDLYFLTKKLTQKYKNMELYKNVVLTIIDEENIQVASIKGEVSFNDNHELVNEMIHKFTIKLNGKYLLHQVLPALKHKGEMTVAKVVVKSVLLRTYIDNGFPEEIKIEY